MKGAGLLRRLSLAAAFLGLGACLLLSARGMCAADGCSVETAEISGREAKLYLPSEEAGASVVLPAHEEGEESVSAGGTVSAALVLSYRLDGSGALALELSRRGVAVLLAGDGIDPREAWDWLQAQPFVRRGSAALLAGDRRAGEALALAESLRGTDADCAAVVLSGEKTLVKTAAGNPAGNLLLLTGQEADEETLTAFYGSAEAARQGFTGFFSEKTARAAAAVGGEDPSFIRSGVLTRVIDWLGSCLGHSVELADDDLICTRVLFCNAGAAGYLLLAAASLAGRRRKEKKTD